MAGEWIRFGICALLIIAGLAAFTAAVIGVQRFGYILNRVHAGGIGDTFGILCIVLSCAIASASAWDALKLGLLVIFMWFTSPVSSHFLVQVEYYTKKHLYRHTDRDLNVRNEREGRN